MTRSVLSEEQSNSLAKSPFLTLAGAIQTAPASKTPNPTAKPSFGEKKATVISQCPPERLSERITIHTGYRPGLLGRTLSMHLAFYHSLTGWGRLFEAKLAIGIGDLLTRLDQPVNEVWLAVLSPNASSPSPGNGAGVGQDNVEGEIVGVIYIDGEIERQPDVARVRCFIVDESVRGRGVGRTLLRKAMEFVREKGFRECRLSTMRELTAARRLYEREGFRPEGKEVWFEEFGTGVWEMRYVWRREDCSEEKGQGSSL